MAAPRRPPAAATPPTCPLTKRGLPVRLLVDGEPPSRGRRAMRLVLVLVVLAGAAAVAAVR